jgi:hypothetical protein
MKYAIITGMLIATILVAGCGKKMRSAGSSTAPPTAQSAQPEAASFPALAVWERGDKAAAVTNFLATDWSSHPLFTTGSVFSLSETQLRALSPAERKAKADEMLPQLLSLRDLAKAVEQAGRDAAAKGDKIQARKYYESLKQCGTALDSPDYTIMLGRVGQAIQNLGEKDLEQIGP